MAGRVENINIQILKQCREQIGLDLFDVETKVKKIATIEEDEQKPTFRQLDILADFYKVPRWVFIADKLPDEYHFQKSVPAFRQFADNPYGIFDDYKIRGLTAKIEQYRELIIELREDMGEPIEPFNPPKFTKICHQLMPQDRYGDGSALRIVLIFRNGKKCLKTKMYLYF